MNLTYARFRHDSLTGWQIRSQMVSIKLNFKIGDDGNRKALNKAESVFGFLLMRAGNVLGSGGQPLSSSNNSESRSSPELATK